MPRESVNIINTLGLHLISCRATDTPVKRDRKATMPALIRPDLEQTRRRHTIEATQSQPSTAWNSSATTVAIRLTGHLRLQQG